LILKHDPEKLQTFRVGSCSRSPAESERADNRGRQMAKSPEERTPAPAGPGSEPATATSRAEIDAFLSKVRAFERGPATGRRGRLIFALDATMSRQPTWDTACRL